MTFVLLAIAWATEPDDAVETDRAAALELFAYGSERYAEGAYQASVDAFEEALRLSEERSLYFNIANAWERAGRLVEAHDALGQYLDVAPAADRAALELRVASLQLRIDAQAAPPEPVVLPVPSDPVPLPRRHPRWLLVGSGVGVAAGGVALAGVTSGRAQVAFADGERSTYDQQRTLNQVSWTGVGLGAGLAVVGLVLRTGPPAGQGLALTF